jgi:homoprotocatechuate degradation regulator HpaR
MMLYRALGAVMPRFRRIFNEFGLTEQQWRVLRVLWEHDGIAFGELADRTLIAAPSMVGIVDRLARQGLVERRRSESDRRNVFVHATRAAKRLERQVQPRVEAAYREHRGSIGETDWKELIAGLDRVASLADEASATTAAVNE